MADQPPIFNLNAYSPAEIKEAIEKVGVKKTTLPLQASFMLAIVAGGSIGLGALYYTIVASDAELSFATIRVVGGLAFSPAARAYVALTPSVGRKPLPLPVVNGTGSRSP